MSQLNIIKTKLKKDKLKLYKETYQKQNLMIMHLILLVDLKTNYFWPDLEKSFKEITIRTKAEHCSYLMYAQQIVVRTLVSA